jgi:signal transduction histidine kinase
VWIAGLILLGGLALDRIVTGTLVRNFDARLAETLPQMIAAAELDSLGDVRFNRPPVEPRFVEPYSGHYWQVSAEGRADFRSRSLWDRRLDLDFNRDCPSVCASRYEGFAGEPLRVVERDGIIPGSPTVFRFAVAESTLALDREIEAVRRTVWLALGVLGLGLFALAALQATVGLLPLKRLSQAIADVRSGRAARVPDDNVPPEVAPLVHEVNALLDHNEAMVAAARTHAGNLAHALKTPISVLMNEAQADSPQLAESVKRELATMRRHVDHHLARSRAAARRPDSAARTPVWPSLERIAAAVTRMHSDREVVVDLAGSRTACFRGEREDFEEMLGNLIDNAAHYGGGRVFVTATEAGDRLVLLIEDDGPGIPVQMRARLFERGARLDTARPGAGLGLAIARDIAAIYGGSIALGESEDLGGLLVTLDLPASAPAAAGAPVA